MLETRVIPCLLLRGEGLVKTIRFSEPTYVGDPINAVRIFNTKEVDELALLDITATPSGRGPNVDLIASITSEAFMPMAYGGGITSCTQIERLLAIGIEKVVLNSAAVANPQLVTDAAGLVGSQAVVVSIDVKKGRLGRYNVYTHAGVRETDLDPVAWAIEVESRGAGEILLTSIDRDGTQSGFDLDLIGNVTRAVSVPVIASGGAGSLDDFVAAVRHGASAVAAGSLFVFRGKHRAVLITYPDRKELESLLAE